MYYTDAVTLPSSWHPDTIVTAAGTVQSRTVTPTHECGKITRHFTNGHADSRMWDNNTPVHERSRRLTAAHASTGDGCNHPQFKREQRQGQLSSTTEVSWVQQPRSAEFNDQGQLGLSIQRNRANPFPAKGLYKQRASWSELSQFPELTRATSTLQDNHHPGEGATCWITPETTPSGTLGQAH